MTNTLKYTAIAMACLAAAACDNIKEEDRFIEMPIVEAQRVVLLEEFTGQDCVNCPEAHELIAALEKAYPDNLVAVSIHGGPLAIDEKDKDYGLKNADGQALYDKFGIYSLPSGIVDRVSGVLNRDQWEAKIREDLARGSSIDLACSADLSADGKSVDIKVTAIPHADANAYIQVYMLESEIVARQLNGDKVDRKYVHHNVMRKAVNGTDGDACSLKNNETFQASYSQAISDRWDAANLSVVAFVYDKDGVLQAAKCNVAAAQ